MHGRKRASPAFDERCYSLRYDEQKSLAEIEETVGACTQTVRRAIRRHAATLSEDAVEEERFGATLRWQEEAARAARRLDRGVSAAEVLATTNFANVVSMMNSVRRYRRSAGRPRPAKTGGRATVQNVRGSPQVVLCTPAMAAAGWNIGDAVQWRVEADAVGLRSYRRDERPHPVVSSDDREALAHFHHHTEGKTWEETGTLVGLSATGAWHAAKRFAQRTPERGLPSTTRGKDSDTGVITVTKTGRGPSVRFSLPAIRLGWKPKDTVEWAWDPRARVLRVRKYVPPPPPPVPPPPPEKKKRGRPPKRKPSSSQA